MYQYSKLNTNIKLSEMDLNKIHITKDLESINFFPEADTYTKTIKNT